MGDHARQIMAHPSRNRKVNGGFDGFELVCRHMFDHAIRENAPYTAVKKRPDALSRTPRRLGDGLARPRPCGTGIGSMMAKGSVKSPCRVPCRQNVHWLLLAAAEKDSKLLLNAGA